MGWLYLLHYERSLSGKGNRHYCGYSHKRPGKRIEQHRTGTAGAVFTTEAYRQGIPFDIGGIWPERTANDERNIKRQKQHARYCAICRPGKQRPMPPRSRPMARQAVSAFADDEY